MGAFFWEFLGNAMTDDFFRNRLDQMIDLRHPIAVLANRMPWRGNPPVKALSGEVEISRREFLDEEVKVFGQPDHGGAQARGVWAGCS
jgi:hypothetical protein